MNIVNRLTLRHIKSHRRRSLLTVLAIIVSVAMVTAVFTSVFSFIKFMQDATKAYDGNWHTQFVYEAAPDLTVFQQSSDLTAYYASAEFTEISCDPSSDSMRARCDIDTVDPSVVTVRNLHITEGRFPEREGEILLTKEYIEKNHLTWQVGDTLTVATKTDGTDDYTDQEYVLSGIADGNVSYFDHCGGCLLRTESNVPSGVTQYVTVTYQKLSNSVYDKSDALAKASGAAGYDTNTDLLYFSGVMKNNDLVGSMLAFVGVMLFIIVVASVVMIYDSFAVSYQERERYLGMLASVGATKRQKRSSLYFEGFLLGLVAVPVGIAAGFAGMFITFRGIQGAFMKTFNLPIEGTLKVHFSPYILLGTVLISALTIFISCYIPARRASKTTPIAAIKGTNTVKVKKAKKLRVSKLTRRLYGFEGELAVKNFKRNGKRSRNIVFALVMSVVMFMTVTNFAVLLDAFIQLETGGTRPDFTVIVNTEDMDKTENFFSSADIKDFIGYQYCEVTLEDTELLTATAQAHQAQFDNENLTVYCMDNTAFDRYLKKLGEKPEGYHDQTAPQAVLFNQIQYPQDNETVTAQAFSDVQGKTLHCVDGSNSGEEADARRFSVKVAAVTDKPADSALFVPTMLWTPSVILPADTYYALMDSESNISYAVFADNYQTVVTQAEDYFEAQGIEYNLQDNGANLEAVKAVTSILKVFVYGFITLLTFIAVINIINAIANAMNERKTEFAMLKSVGVTPKGFKKMIYVESVRYGVQSLLWSIPISFGLHYLLYYMLTSAEGVSVPFSFNLPYYGAAILAVFLIILLSLLYSADKIKDDSIIEHLKQD
ncbi:MAG: FtsX-like permease family protein [Eubacterium sp.]|nr:FtsX-like permease family protein [Eubacterium sp.]